MPAQALDVLGVVKNLDAITKKLNVPLLQELDLLAEAVSHSIKSLSPDNRDDAMSEDLCIEIRHFSTRFHSATNAYKNGEEFRHYYNYILDVASEIHWEKPAEEMVHTLRQHGETLKNGHHQDSMAKLKKQKRSETAAKRNKRLGELAKLYGLRSVGHFDPDRTPFNVRCVDAYTHALLDVADISIEGMDDEPDRSTPQAAATASLAHPERTTSSPTKIKGKKKVKKREKARMQREEANAKARRKNSSQPDPAVPPPAMASPFPSEGFVTQKMLGDAKFTTYTHGTVYGFARAPNGIYSMVWAVQFSPVGSFSAVEQEAVDVFIEYMTLAEAHAHEVKNNRAQNGNKAQRTAGAKVSDMVIKLPIIRNGRLFGSGWRPGRAPGEAAGEYTPQSEHDKHDPEGYIDMHQKQELVNIAWMVLQHRLSPRAVQSNLGALADMPVPLFGSHDEDVTTHGPSLGSNMSVSMQDEEGRNFANSMHTDRDIDSLPEFQGKIFTMGQWINTKNGKLVEGDELRRAIPEGYFVLPGYRVAFDLGGAALISAMWRGGMDLHGTSTSNVDLDSKVTRWGMSIQTNKKLPNVMRSGKGVLFGAYSRLRAYYDALFPPDES